MVREALRAAISRASVLLLACRGPYADEPGAEALKEALKLTHAARSANAVLHVPTDESLFLDAGEPTPNVFCTSPVVTYLDLWAGSDRDRGAEEHLAGAFFP